MQWVLDNAPALFSEIHEQAHQMEADSAKLALLLTNFEKMAATVENARERPPSNREARESGEAEDGGEEDDAQPESPRRAWSAPPSSLGRTDSADLRAAVKSTQMMKQTINAFTASQKARRRARRRNATASSSVLAELGDNGDLVETVRRTIVAIQTASDRAVGLLQNIVRERDATSRADNLLALDELVGSKPARSWQDEWVAMVCEHHQTTEFKVDDDCPPISTLSEKELSEYVSKRFSIEHYTQKHADYIAVTVATGWPEERADIFQHLSYATHAASRLYRRTPPREAISRRARAGRMYVGHSLTIPRMPHVRVLHTVRAIYAGTSRRRLRARCATVTRAMLPPPTRCATPSSTSGATPPTPRRRGRCLRSCTPTSMAPPRSPLTSPRGRTSSSPT